MDPSEVVSYWIGTVGPGGWYAGGEALDREVARRFGSLWQEARRGGLAEWRVSPAGSFAYILLTDQFPRNMFRDTADAFATDRHALACARTAVHHRWDMRFAEPGRQFFYLPFMHAENQYDQDRCIRLMLTRMPETGAENILHARAHREVIRRFGRFPTRNAALGRPTTPAEAQWLAAGGYGATVRALRQPAG